MTISPKRIADLREMLAAVTEGHLSIEPDEYLSTFHRDVWRIVGAEARKRRKEQNTTARPVYVATVYSDEYTQLFVAAVTVLPALLDEIEELRAVAEEPGTDQDFFHAIHPVPKCCGGDMEREGNLSLHVLGYKCPSCSRYLQAAVTFTEGRPNTDPATLSLIDETP